MLISLVLRCLLVLVLGLGTFALGVWQRQATGHQSITPIAQAVWPAPAGVGSGRWLLEARGRIPMPADTLAAHASNLLAMPPGHTAALTAFWFAGDRESAPNVQIAASQWDRTHQKWMPARFVVNRHTMGEQLGYGLRRLGNPVAWIDGEGRMHLFVVATGWGGWAASRVLQLRQRSAGNGLNELQFEPVRVLPLSWLWNISYLVRNPPLALADGGMVMPVHFELGTKHASALQFDAQGAYLGMVRISAHQDRLQPALVMESPTAWWAFMRVQREHGKIAVSRTRDAGRNWEDQPDLPLDNPDAAVAGVGLAPHRMVLAYNPSDKGRTALNLGESVNGQSWSVAAAMEKGIEPDEFSYPAMAWSDGKLWVSYTADRTHIQWQRFAPSATNTGEAP
jgi:predicted neuraminidase